MSERLDIDKSKSPSLRKRVAELEKENAQLKDEIAHLRRPYEKAPLSYQSLDENGCFIDVNQAWLDNLGYSREEVLGKNFSEFLKPDWRDHFSTKFPKFKSIGEILGAEFNMIRKDGSAILVSFHGKIGKDSLGNFQQTHCIFEDITKRRQTEKTLQRIEWMLSPKPSVLGKQSVPEPTNEPNYGDLAVLNRGGLIFKSIDNNLLQEIASEYLDLLETSSAIYEKNGDYALGLFSSSWCSFLDSSSRRLCNTDDNAVALASGKWHCHESCWAHASKTAIETQKPVDIPCHGGLRLYAVPIFANGEAIGAINFGHGDPPNDPSQLRALADLYEIDYEQLVQEADKYDSRPHFIIELAKKRLQASARLISLLVERKIAEEALINSEVLHRTLIDNIPDLVWLKDVEGVYLSCNKRFELFFGAKESDIIGKTDYDFHKKESADFFRRHDFKAIETDGSSVNEEWRTCADNGHHGLFETIRTPMRDTKGDIVGVLGIARDITERKNQDKKLKNLVREQGIILDNVPVFIIFKDTQNNIIKITNSVAVMTGLPKNKIEGRPTKEVYPDMADKYWQDDLEVIRTGQPKLGYVEPLPTADGKTKWLLTDKIPYFEDDKVAGILVISTDISERIVYENRLKESEMRFRSLFENAADAIYLVSMEGKILDVNSVAQKQTGYSKKELLAMEIRDLDTRAIVEHDRENIWEKIESGEIATLSTHHLRKDNSLVPVEISLTRFEFQEDIFLLAFVRDVTEKLETERQLRQSQKHESIGNLAGGIAHDFNNILASIIGYTELALEDAPPRSSQHESLREVLFAGGRAKELVQQILTFARKSDEKIQPVELGEIVSEVTKLIRSSLPTTIEIVQVFQSTSPIMADPAQISQVLMNLCTNAAYAMQENGGVLEVTMKNVVLYDDLKTEGKNLSARRYAELTVSDTGTGIDPVVIDKIFDPYFTTKGVGEGTGLGLAMVKGIVESHGGHIEVTSIPNIRTSFVIYLPITAKMETKSPSPGPVTPTGSEHILFVDDDSMIVELGSRILERLGYTVTAKNSSLEALELFKKNASTFDLVITDMTMPHLTGDILAMELRKIRPDIPIIICSGYSNKINKESARDMHINAYLNKPISKSELASTVRNVLEKANA